MTALALIAGGYPLREPVPERLAPTGKETSEQRRSCWFAGLGWIETAVIGRAALRPAERAGPLIIAEYDATTLVPPGASAALGEFGMIRLPLG
ncbi:MAG: hypothetical protein ACREF0_10855 [Acetobacteraceae bacterium]